jgi:hypothetical protein
MNDLQYKKKYLKYKNKYLKLKGGMDSDDEECEKCEEREDITVTINLLNGDEFHITIPQNSTIAELYNRIETILSSNVDLYIKETPISEGLLIDNDIIDGSKLECVIREKNFVINPQALQQNYTDVWFREEKNYIQIIITFEGNRDWWDTGTIMDPVYVLLYCFEDYYPRRDSIINPQTKLTVSKIKQVINDNLDFFEEHVSCENFIFIQTSEFIDHFINECCMPYVDISMEDYLKNIIFEQQRYFIEENTDEYGQPIYDEHGQLIKGLEPCIQEDMDKDVCKCECECELPITITINGINGDSVIIELQPHETTKDLFLKVKKHFKKPDFMLYDINGDRITELDNIKDGDNLTYIIPDKKSIKTIKQLSTLLYQWFSEEKQRDFIIKIYGHIQDWDVTMIDNFTDIFKKMSEIKSFNEMIYNSTINWKEELGNWKIHDKAYIQDVFNGVPEELIPDWARK